MIERFKGEPGEAIMAGKRYVWRDVTLQDGNYIQWFSQYKTRREDGCIVWKPFPRDDAKWSELEPFNG